MTLDAMIKIIIDITTEKRLIELHNCPDCKTWLELHGGWQEGFFLNGISKKKNVVYCLNCHKKITVVLAGEWIKLWEKYWGFD